MELLTVEDVANELRLCTTTVLRLLRTGKLKGSKFARRWRVPRQDLDAFVQAHRGKPAMKRRTKK